jgi:cathepsin B
VLSVYAAGDESPATNSDIISHVNNAQTSWKAGHNKRFQGLKIKDIKRLCGTAITGAAELPIKEVDIPAALPATFDARTQWPDCIGAIRDQGHCGSCWAFGAVEALSDRFCIQSKGQNKVILAAQDPTSCDASNEGCNGGFLAAVWKYMSSTGVVSEGCYPYEMGTCHHPGCSELPTPKCNKSCSIASLNFAADKHHAASAYSIARNITAIAAEIMTNGPVEAAFTVYEDFNNYMSGVYHHVTGSAEGGHAIKIIGWGTESGTDYWLVANSWNTDWGDQGFFKIRRGTNECGIEAQVTAGLAKV